MSTQGLFAHSNSTWTTVTRSPKRKSKAKNASLKTDTFVIEEPDHDFEEANKEIKRLLRLNDDKENVQNSNDAIVPPSRSGNKSPIGAERIQSKTSMLGSLATVDFAPFYEQR